ncbi:uncharacterized protein LOC127974375 [Carassius gibelio]|uniref:uncharacterized protein LOC127974375 n=1 Tax=Carassius gibelio TaxID=101364 RepID=UPI0022798BA3|nr:uncharacterized protein LOC127974375 [Carassius gibelio]
MPETSTTPDVSTTEPSTQNTVFQPRTIELPVASTNDSNTHSVQLTSAPPDQESIIPHTEVPESAVLVICTHNETHKTYPNCLSINTQAPTPKLLGNLIEKGVARKLYVTITLEKEMRLEALVDTGSDLTLISAQLFDKLKFEAQRQNRTLNFHTCKLNVQSYSQNDIQLRNVAPIDLTIGPMSLVHPIYVSPMDNYSFLIGKDLLNRFEPLLDFKQLKVWAQVREPLPLQPHSSPVPDGQVTEVTTIPTVPDCQVTEVTTIPTEPDCRVTEVTGTPAASHRYPASTTNQGSSSILCTFKATKDSDTYCPKVKTELQLHDITTTDSILAIWADNSAISLSLYNAITEKTPDLPYASKRTRFPLNSHPSSMVSAGGICALHVKWNYRCLTHYFLVLPDLPHDVYIGADLLICLKAHVDTFNEVVWAPLTLQPHVSINHDNLISGQTIPEVCTLVNEQEMVVPAYTKGVAIRLNMRWGQTLNHTLGFFQPSPECVELGLTLEATPLIEVSSRVVYILFNNCTATDINIPKAYRLGWLVSNDFHDFELVLPVIGPIPPALIPEGNTDNTLFTAPFKLIAITSVMSVCKDQVCRTELTEDQHLTIYTISHQNVGEANESTTPLNTNPTDDTPMEEPYPGFESQVQQILQDANALQSDTDRQGLRQVLYKFKESFAKDSL